VPFGHIVDRTDWTTNAAQFDFLANWISINHQQGAAGQFEFYRKGEWLTKQLDNYDDNLNGQSSRWHNMLSLQNWCAAGDRPWVSTSSCSSMAANTCSANLPAIPSPSPPDSNYTYACADLTPLFNYPDVWEPQIATVDIQQATRNILWIKPDHIVVYDRAASVHSGLFKQFNLNLVAIPSVSGHTVTERTASGQQLLVQTILPTNAIAAYVPVNSITTISQEEPSVGRVIIEDTNDPVSIRFLHVLQGADSNATQDAVVHVASTGGNAFEGATVRGVAVMFPVDVLSNNFTSLTYLVRWDHQSLYRRSFA